MHTFWKSNLEHLDDTANNPVLYAWPLYITGRGRWLDVL